MATYPSSLTDTEWEILQPLLPQKADTMRGRPVENPRREIIDGILYILRRNPLYSKDLRGLAHDAQRLASLENLLSLLPAVVQAGPLGTNPQRDPRHGPHGSRKKKPRRLRSSTARAFEQLANPDFVDLMRVRKLQEERDTFW